MVQHADPRRNLYTHTGKFCLIKIISFFSILLVLLSNQVFANCAYDVSMEVTGVWLAQKLEPDSMLKMARSTYEQAVHEDAETFKMFQNKYQEYINNEALLGDWKYARPLQCNSTCFFSCGNRSANCNNGQKLKDCDEAIYKCLVFNKKVAEEYEKYLIKKICPADEQEKLKQTGGSKSTSQSSANNTKEQTKSEAKDDKNKKTKKVAEKKATQDKKEAAAKAQNDAELKNFTNCLKNANSKECRISKTILDANNATLQGNIEQYKIDRSDMIKETVSEAEHVYCDGKIINKEIVYKCEITACKDNLVPSKDKDSCEKSKDAKKQDKKDAKAAEKQATQEAKTQLEQEFLAKIDELTKAYDDKVKELTTNE